MDKSQQVALYKDPGQLGPGRARPDSSGSNVISRRARPGQAGLGPDTLFGQYPRYRSTSLKRKHPLLVRSTHRYLAHEKTPTPWDRDRTLGTVLLYMKDPRARPFPMSRASLHRTGWTTLNPDRNGGGCMGTAARKDAGLCCGSGILEGRSVCLCWAPSKPKGPKGRTVQGYLAHKKKLTLLGPP